ncbi:MAG: insulinase family protein [Candidatus Peregrinibacteria bacterium]
MPARHRDEYTEKVLAAILGGNMSSRMFLNVREAKGLCYYIKSGTDDYADTGVISTSAGVDVKRIDMAIEGILEQYALIMKEPVGKAELNKAKEFMKGKIVLRLEDSEEYAHLMGKQALLYSKVEDVERILEKIDAVTSEDILRLSQSLFVEDRLRLAIIGPYDKQEHFSKRLHY